MRPRRSRKLLTTTAGLIVLAGAWFYLAPVQLGGSTSYVVTHGISMEPRFHTGDLAILRSQPSYHVGEIVAYHNYKLHRTVLHRIIARDGSRYVFKGDNNNFVDPEHPAASQLIGALWVHIPRVGGVLQSVRSPALIGLLLAVGRDPAHGGGGRPPRDGAGAHSGAPGRAPGDRPVSACGPPRGPWAACSPSGCSR